VDMLHILQDKAPGRTVHPGALSLVRLAEMELRDEVAAVGERDCLGAAGNAQLGQDAAYMRFDRRWTEIQL